ncbi:MAG: hypothetical protein AMXMBFR33_38600 [Candidatus Xenobia bacterium]
MTARIESGVGDFTDEFRYYLATAELASKAINHSKITLPGLMIALFNPALGATSALDVNSGSAKEAILSVFKKTDFTEVMRQFYEHLPLLLRKPGDMDIQRASSEILAIRGILADIDRRLLMIERTFNADEMDA